MGPPSRRRWQERGFKMTNRLSGLLDRLTGRGPVASPATQPSPVPRGADERIYYRTLDGTTDICFLFRDCGENGWRAYILSNLDYGRRDASAAVSHRLYDSELGLHYVCWSTRITTKDQCKAIAKLWSDKTMDYIRKGTPIP